MFICVFGVWGFGVFDVSVDVEFRTTPTQQQQHTNKQPTPNSQQRGELREEREQRAKRERHSSEQ